MRAAGKLASVFVALTVIVGSLAVSPSAEAATYPCTKNQTLRVGQMNSTCVKAMQTYLNGYVNAKLVLDGDFGSKTEQAVMNYQRRVKIGADGIVGPETRLAVFNHTGIPTNSGATQSQIIAAGEAAIQMCRGWGFAFD